MRASTLTAILASAVIGLVAVVAARSFGLFGGAETTAPVLVAGRNILVGTLVSASDVVVRATTPAEYREMIAHPDDYLPAIPQAVSQRVTERIIEANRPIRRSDFQPLELPEPLRSRLAPGKRSVNVAASKARSSGGVIQPGDWVDVELTTGVSGPDGSAQVRTARIAQGVRVVLKRNSLYPIFAPLPDDQDIDFTLEANPFRAALIEHAKTKGELTLNVLGDQERGKLESDRIKALAGRGEAAKSAVNDEEARRLAAFLAGNDSVGDEDLAEIFALIPPRSKVPPVVIERFVAGKRVADATFPVKATVADLASDRGGSTPFRFDKPAGDAAAARREQQARARQTTAAAAGTQPQAGNQASNALPAALRRPQ